MVARCDVDVDGSIAGDGEIHYRVARHDGGQHHAARGFDFDPVNSDVDFLVTYDLAEQAPSLEAYFGLTNDLAALLGLPVDLVMSGAVRNPFVRADIERSREPLYAA